MTAVLAKDCQAQIPHLNGDAFLNSRLQGKQPQSRYRALPMSTSISKSAGSRKRKQWAKICSASKYTATFPAQCQVAATWTHSNQDTGWVDGHTPVGFRFSIQGLACKRITEGSNPRGGCQVAAHTGAGL